MTAVRKCVAGRLASIAIALPPEADALRFTGSATRWATGELRWGRSDAMPDGAAGETKVAVIGAGAVGGYYGGALARAGLDVALICRGEHRDAIVSDGLRVTSNWGDYTVHPKATPDSTEIGPVDLVLYAVKLYSNPSALPLIEPLLGDGTVVLPLQNGTESAAKIAESYGWDRVLAGTTYIEAARTGLGQIEQTGSTARIAFGEQDGKRLPGQIYLCLSDEQQSVIAGSCEAEVSGFMLVDGKPDLTKEGPGGRGMEKSKSRNAGTTPAASLKPSCATDGHGWDREAGRHEGTKARSVKPRPLVAGKG